MKKGENSISWFRFEEHLIEWSILLISITSFAFLFALNFNTLVFDNGKIDYWIVLISAYITIPILWRFSYEFQKINIETTNNKLIITMGPFQKKEMSVDLDTAQVKMTKVNRHRFLNSKRHSLEIIIEDSLGNIVQLPPISNINFANDLYLSLRNKVYTYNSMNMVA